MIPQRYILVFLASSGVLTVNWMNAGLSVAILDMVNNTDTKSKNITSENCPSLFKNESPGEFHQATGKLDWSPEILGIVLSAYYWGYLVVLVPVGILSQKYGGKWMFGGGILIAGVITLLSPVIAKTNVYVYLVVRILQGISESAANPSIMAILGRWCPPEENAVLVAAVFIAVPIGTYVGLSISGPLVIATSLGGWTSAFYTGSALGILLCIPWGILVYDSPEKHPWISKKEKDYIINSIGRRPQEEEFRQPIPWKGILLSGYVWVYVLTSAVWGWSFYTLLNSIPRFVSDVLHFEMASNILIAMLPYLIYTILINCYPWISEPVISRHLIGKTKVRKLFTLISLGGSGISFFGTALADCNRNAVIALLFVNYVFLAASPAGFLSNALDLSPENSGILFGLAQGATTVSGVVAIIVSNLVAKDGTKSEWDIVLCAAGAACAFGCIIYVLFSSSDRQEWNLNVGERAPLSPESGKGSE